MTAIIHPPRRKPKADKMQRKHLMARIDRHMQNLLGALRKREGRYWGSEMDEPAEVVAARKVIQKYEDQRDAEYEAKESQLTRLAGWLKEQVLFHDAEKALEVTKRFEILHLEDAMESGKTMEDRNDAPLLNFPKLAPPTI